MRTVRCEGRGVRITPLTAYLKLSRSHKSLDGVGVFIKDLLHLSRVRGGEAGDGLGDERQEEDGDVVEGDHVLSDKEPGEVR